MDAESSHENQLEGTMEKANREITYSESHRAENIWRSGICKRKMLHRFYLVLFLPFASKDVDFSSSCSNSAYFSTLMILVCL